MIKFIHTTIISVVGTLLFTAVGTAHSAEQRTTAGIEEVLVTAQRREESLQDVPVSISTFTGDFLNAAGINDINDLQNYTPSMLIVHSTTPRNTTIRIRGVGSSGQNSGIEPGVGTYLDGIYLVRPGMLLGELNDIERVEVLRGPQGTLYGRNNSIGALNVVTRDPTQSFEGYLKFGAGIGDEDIGGYDQRYANGFISGGLGENMSGRLSFHMRERSGFTKNLAAPHGDANDLESAGVRAKVLWAPSDRIEVKLIADYMLIDSDCCAAELAVATPGLYAWSERAGAPIRDAEGDNWVIDQLTTNPGKDEQMGIAAIVDVQLGGSLEGHTLESITAVRSWENDQFLTFNTTRADCCTSNQYEKQDTIQQEFRIASPVGKFLEYQLGTFFWYQDTVFTQENIWGAAIVQAPAVLAGILTFPEEDIGARDPTDAKLKTTSAAAFSEFTLNATERANLTLGLRWTVDDKKAKVSHTLVGAEGGLPIGTLLRAIRPVSFFDDSKTDDELTWTATGQYFFSAAPVADQLMGYLTVSKGFKSGGFNARRISQGSQFEFDKEITMNYEAGIKSTWLGSRLLLNASLFRMDVEDFQASIVNPTASGTIVTNAAKLRQTGVEVEVQAQPSTNLTVSGSLAYLDSEFMDFVGAPCAANPSDPNLLQVPGNPGAGCDLTGQPNEDTPEWQANVNATYQRPWPGRDFDWMVRAEWQYVDDHYQNADLDVYSFQPAYSLFNFRLGLEADRWRVTAWVKNAFDKSYKTESLDVIVAGLLGGAGSMMQWNAPPRTAGIEVALHF